MHVFILEFILLFIYVHSLLIGLLGVLPELELLPYELTNKTLASTQSTYKFITYSPELSFILFILVFNVCTNVLEFVFILFA